MRSDAVAFAQTGRDHVNMPAVMAGALGLALAGPRHYPGHVAQERWIGDGRARADTGDIRSATFILAVACLLNFGMIAGVMLVQLKW